MSSEPSNLFTRAGDNKPEYRDGVKEQTKPILKSYLDLFCKKFSSNISNFRYFNMEIKGNLYPVIDSTVEDELFKNVNFQISTGDAFNYNSYNSRMWVKRLKEGKWYWCNFNVIENEDINKELLFYYILNDDNKIKDMHLNKDVFTDILAMRKNDPFENFPFDISNIISK